MRPLQETEGDLRLTAGSRQTPRRGPTDPAGQRRRPRRSPFFHGLPSMGGPVLSLRHKRGTNTGNPARGWFFYAFFLAAPVRQGASQRPFHAAPQGKAAPLTGHAPAPLLRPTAPAEGRSRGQAAEAARRSWPRPPARQGGRPGASLFLRHVQNAEAERAAVIGNSAAGTGGQYFGEGLAVKDSLLDGLVIHRRRR